MPAAAIQKMNSVGPSSFINPGEKVVRRETPELMLCPQATSWSEVYVTEKIEVGFALRSQAC